VSFNPTQEQQAIKEAFESTRVLKVNACAGSGKTSTLIYLADNNPKPSLYICFNKVIAEEARTKFPDHVECRTTHSLAYQQFGKGLFHKLSRPKGAYKNVAGTSAETQKYYSIHDYTKCKPSISGKTIAALVRETVKRFQNSAEDNLEYKHIPYYEIVQLQKNHDDLDTGALSKEVLSYAKQLWKDRINQHSPVLANPDTYLKLWQLSKPILNFDILYFDEAQDTNPAVLDVIQRQNCKICYVGDTYQSIYQFRGAVNAMETIIAPTKYLSKSFRYGAEIAKVAKTIIAGAIEVKGLESIDSRVSPLRDDTGVYTFIFRTNSALLEKAIELIDAGESIAVEVDIKSFIKKLEAAQYLYQGKTNEIKHDDIACFSSWLDLVEAAQEDADLKRISKIVSEKRTNYYIEKFNEIVSKTKANVLLTTAHKSKGKEWNYVKVADDFMLRTKEGKQVLKDVPQAELNMLYVACTRATHNLEIPFDLFEFVYPKAKSLVCKVTDLLERNLI
jgi:superfamily I DNA/RNA helicase